MVEGTKKSDSNVYDIIYYFKDDINENQDQTTVHDVIKSIEREENIHQNINDDEKKNGKAGALSWSVKWRLFGCFLMNVLLSSPIYGFVSIYLLHKDKLGSRIAIIWIPIIFNSVYLLVTPWLFNTLISSSPQVNASNRLTNRNVIIIFTLIMSTSISISGFTFSYLDANIIVILLFYSIVGGK